MESVAQTSLEKALQYIHTNKSRSFVHLLVALNLQPGWKSLMSSLFNSLADSLAVELLVARRTGDFFNCFEQALELYPESADLKHCFSRHLHSLGYTFRAFSFLSSAVKLKPEDPLWNRELDSMKNTLVERWHYRMLNDSIRNDAYRQAISKCVNESSSVLDIGCGSGLLTLYVAESSPNRLVAVESNEALYNVALAVFNDNNLENITIKNANSTTLIPEDIRGKVSVIVTEIFDGGFFGEGVLQTLIHARKFLMENRKTDVIIPESASLYICGLQSTLLAGKYCVLNSILEDYINVNGFFIFSESEEPYDTEDLSKILDLKYVSNVENFLNVNFSDIHQMEKLNNGDEVSFNLKINSDVEIHALGIWFDLQLCENVKLTTNPLAENRAKAWEQAVIYIRKPIIHQENSLLKITLSYKAGKLNVVNSNSSCSEFMYPVPLQIIKLLNDKLYLRACNMAAGAICVYLSQMFPLQDMHALDLSPFPLIGFLLLIRGMQSLTCLAHSPIVQQLIVDLAKSNKIDPRKISFVGGCGEIDGNNLKDYKVIINNYFTNCYGELNSKLIQKFITFKSEIHNVGSVMVPYKIRMMGRLIYSEEVERINRVSNINVSNYKIAESMNVFQVSQNYISDMSSFIHKSMSNDIIIFEQCIDVCDNKIIDIEFIEDGLINSLLCWYEIQLLEKWEFYSTLPSNSFLDSVLYILEPNLSGLRHQKGNLLVCVQDNCIKFAVDCDVSQ